MNETQVTITFRCEAVDSDHKPDGQTKVLWALVPQNLFPEDVADTELRCALNEALQCVRVRKEWGEWK